MKLSELAIWYNKYGFNVLPVDGKRPTIPWENWQLIEQTKKDIASFGWNANVTGIGGICGINEIRNLDFDKVTDPEIMEMFSKAFRARRDLSMDHTKRERKRVSYLV